MTEQPAPRRTDPIAAALAFAIREAVRLEVALNMNGLSPEDVVVELLMRRSAKRDGQDYLHFNFSFYGMSADGNEHLFALDLSPDLCGRLDYKIRVYPFHELLTHPLEMGLMKALSRSVLKSNMARL